MNLELIDRLPTHGKTERDHYMQHPISLFDIPFDPYTQKEAIQAIADRVKAQHKTRVVTINPEFVLESMENAQFKNVLKTADIHLADGIGILWATHFLARKPLFPRLYKLTKPLYIFWQLCYSLVLIPFTKRVTRDPLPERVTGSDLFLPLVEELNKNQERIFLLGGANGVGEKTAKKLQEFFPGIKIAGFFPGSPKETDAAKIIHIINDSKASVLFVAFQFPAQDIWIAEHFHKLHHVKLAMGVGGTFDFIAKTSHIAHKGFKAKRAPGLLRRMNLEWFWRLITQPFRFIRIMRATFVFIGKVWREKLKNPVIS